MDVRVLTLSPADLAAPMPLWEVTITPGDVGIAVIDGTAQEWAAADHARATRELATAPVVTVAIVRDGDPSPLAAACDVAVRAAGLDGVVKRISAAGAPALVAAQVLRASAPEVAHESFAYSMLLAGDAFGLWRAAHDRREPPPDADRRRVAVERCGDRLVIRLLRPDHHNAFDALMREQLCDAVDAVTSASAGPIVFVADGPSFCAGGDLDEFGTATDPVAAHVVRTTRSVARRLERIADRLVVGVHGNCIGAGIELAAFARVVVAATSTRFALPELSLGLGLGAGGTVSIPRRIGRRRTFELLLSNRSIDAATAIDWGLVDELVDEHDVEGRCLERAANLDREPVT